MANENRDLISISIHDIVYSLSEHLAVINLYNTKTLKNTVQGLWQICTVMPNVDAIFGWEDGWVTFSGSMSANLESDLKVLYSRCMYLHSSSNVPLKGIIDRLTENAWIYYGDSDSSAANVKYMRSVYTDNPYLIVFKLMEMLDSMQLETIGIKPVKQIGI